MCEFGILSMSSLNFNRKNCGNYVTVLVEAPKYDLSELRELLRDYTKYFSADDRIKLFIQGCPDNIRQALDITVREASLENIFSSIPEIIINGAIGFKNSQIILYENLRKSGDRLPLWARIFEIYSQYSSGNSLYETIEASMWYDTVGIIERIENNEKDITMSTLLSPYEIEFINFIKQCNINSVLDLGCGSGAFFHLLHSTMDVKFIYRGYDFSRNQILNCFRNFGPEFFDVRDISRINIEEFNEYDALHCYSVLNFINSNDQLNIIKNILKSNTIGLFSVNVTMKQEEYIIPSGYENFANSRMENSIIFTPVHYLYLEDLIKVLDTFKSKYYFEFFEKSIPGLFDMGNSYKNDTLLVKEEDLKDLLLKGDVKFFRDKKYIQVNIIPIKWKKVKDSLNINFDKIYQKENIKMAYLNTLKPYRKQ